MGRITVVNKHLVISGEYIGRPSPLGNPFIIGKDGTRNEVIAKYQSWLNIQAHDNKKVATELMRLCDLASKGDLVLVCWCAPQACHGDIIKSFIEEII